jgi:phytoene desaturase
VVGGGLGGLAAAALLGRARLRVTLPEATPELGGKSHRTTLDGQRIDTGPEILTFLGIWEEYLRRWDELGGDDGHSGAELVGLDLRGLPELGTYYYRGEVCSLPVEEGHPWHAAWERYVGINATFSPDVTLLLSSDWKDPRIRPVLGRMASLARLTAKGSSTTSASSISRPGPENIWLGSRAVAHGSRGQAWTPACGYTGGLRRASEGWG